ncbi:hypothetical protein LY76DRAFT_25625 [Colletotrichum caudatum]|nr:hypothetical protein LY76DRAFT_25625 [Colletotrichum caudatum]
MACGSDIYYGRRAWGIWSHALWAANTPRQRFKDGVSWFDVFFGVFARHPEDIRQQGSRLSRETGTFTSKAIGDWSVERKRCIVPGSMAWIHPKREHFNQNYKRSEWIRVDPTAFFPKQNQPKMKRKPEGGEKKRREKKRTLDVEDRCFLFARATHVMDHKRGELKEGS